MKITKQQSSFTPSLVQLINVPHGQPVRTSDGSNKLLMRVKPVNFLLNSDLINDCINRGKVFVVDLAKGTLYITEGDKQVQLIESQLTWSEQ